MGLVEVNEAFAAQVLAVLKGWDWEDRARLNVNGSGISLGHPIGATGVRIMTTLLHEMERREVRYGLETMCIGGGQGMAAIFSSARSNAARPPSRGAIALRTAKARYGGRMTLVERLRACLAEEQWSFAPHERPTMPGSPASPDHEMRLRIIYGSVGILIGLTGGLGTALISVNTVQLQGAALGRGSAEIAWLLTVYVMTNASINLLLIKFRQQFGLRSFAIIFVSLYALFAFCHLFVQGFWSAIAVRAASGMAGAALSTLGIYYIMQAIPRQWRLNALVLGLGVAQCAVPLARLFSPDLLALSQWHALYLFEFGLALLSLAAVCAHAAAADGNAARFRTSRFG